MKSFLFITHLTPAKRRSPLRESLRVLYLESLHNQTYNNWKVLILGEQEKKEEKMWEVPLDYSADKETLLGSIAEVYNRPDVLDYINSSDYIVKLDDDDIISPTVLKEVSELDFDVYYDEWHSFYDISSGQFAQQKRPWIASTCIHKRELAFEKLPGKSGENIYSNSVFYSDHSQVWHRFYENKKRKTTSKSNPVYLRVLSPTSYSSGAAKFPLMNTGEIDFEKYKAYLSSFGKWNSMPLKNFDAYYNKLSLAWKGFSGTDQKRIEFPGYIGNMLKRIKHKIKK